MESILQSTKKMLGLTEEYKVFDPDVIMHINSVLMILTQIGVGPSEGFTISDEYATWEDFLGEDKRIEAVKSYVYYKVKLMFDPPQSSNVSNAMDKVISELEWRLSVAVDPITTIQNGGIDND